MLLFFDPFIYFRERDWGGVEEEEERISSRLCAEHGARCGAQSHDPEITI